MKRLKLTVWVNCKDSTDTDGLVSDLNDGLLCDDVSQVEVHCENNGKNYDFENPDFEED